MRTFLTSITLFCVAIGLVSCEKEVDFNFGDTPAKLVVEGVIETGMPPFVVLTKSIGFFAKVDTNTLANSFVHNAKVTVNDGSRTIQLKEYSFNTGGINFSFYSIDSANVVDFTFIGQFNRTYKLTIEHEGEIYEATTSITQPKELDSLWAKTPLGESNTRDSNAVQLVAKYQDPDTLGNRYRYFTKRNNEEFLAPYFSLIDDAIINGTTTELELASGFRRGDTSLRGNFGYFFKGDTVILKWCAVDKGVFEFWRTLEFSMGATGNPFAAPTKVSSNVSNGALGAWSGYGAIYDTLIIPK